MRVAFAAAFTSAAIISVSAGSGLSVSIGSLAAKGVDNLVVTTSIQNTGDEPLKLLNDPHGPLSTANTKTFKFSNENGSPDFTGIRLKYSPEYVVKKGNPDDFTVLVPGQSLEITHNLANAYNFTRVGSGQFTVDVSNRFYYVDASGKLATIEATTQSSKIALTGSLVSDHNVRRTSIGRKRQTGGATFNGCSADQQQLITEAIPFTDKYASSAVAYFEGATPDATYYTPWFGAADNQTRVNLVYTHFKNIVGDALVSNYDCTGLECPTNTTFAFVYPDQPGFVHLCDAFWQAPTTGKDSKAGTIIHEQSHFTVNAGTLDLQYGVEGCQELAQTDPNSAVMNADSHEYFVEFNFSQ